METLNINQYTTSTLTICDVHGVNSNGHHDTITVATSNPWVEYDYDDVDACQIQSSIRHVVCTICNDVAVRLTYHIEKQRSFNFISDLPEPHKLTEEALRDVITNFRVAKVAIVIRKRLQSNMDITDEIHRLEMELKEAFMARMLSPKVRISFYCKQLVYYINPISDCIQIILFAKLTHQLLKPFYIKLKDLWELYINLTNEMIMLIRKSPIITTLFEKKILLLNENMYAAYQAAKSNNVTEAKVILKDQILEVASLKTSLLNILYCINTVDF